MLKKKNLCRVEIVDSKGNWHTDCFMGQLEKGDIYRLKRPNGSYVKDANGQHIFMCKKQPEIQSIPIG